MARTNLTDARIGAIRPCKSACDLRDGKLGGFGVHVLPSGGKRVFVHCQYRSERAGKPGPLRSTVPISASSPCPISPAGRSPTSTARTSPTGSPRCAPRLRRPTGRYRCFRRSCARPKRWRSGPRAPTPAGVSAASPDTAPDVVHGATIRGKCEGFQDLTPPRGLTPCDHSVTSANCALKVLDGARLWLVSTAGGCRRTAAPCCCGKLTGSSA